MKVCIIGAGPCGLSAALELLENGHQVTVIEKMHQVGGLCGTVQYKGFRFDFGGHRILTDNAILLEKIKRILRDDLLVSNGNSTILDTKLSFKFPLDVRDLASKLGVKSAKAAISYFNKHVLRKTKDISSDSFESWVTKKVGFFLYNRFFGPYVEKVWGLPGNQISAELACQRIQSINLSDTTLSWGKKKKNLFEIPESQYFYPRLGMGMLFEKMAERILYLGGTIINRAELKDLIVNEDSVSQVVYTHLGKTYSLSTDWLLSTMPIHSLLKFLQLDRISTIQSSLKNMPFRSFRFLNILLDFPQLSPYTWQYVPNREISFARIQEPKHRSPFLSPMNKTSIMLEIPCNKGDEIWNADQKSLFQRAIKELKELGFDIENHVIDYFCTNAEHGIPIGTVNIKEHQQKTYQVLRTFKNVSTAGRQGFFTYIFSNSAMEMGMKAGQYIHQVYLKKVAPDTYSYMRFHSDFDLAAGSV